MLGIYLVGSWIGYEVIQGLTEGLGLPAWFPALALVLFIVGLPIVLATAFVQAGLPSPSSDRGDPTLIPDAGPTAPGHAGPDSQVARLFTWRNAVAGGVVAFALWGLVATGWLLLGNEPGESAAMTAGRASVAVLPFENMTGQEENEGFTNGIHDDLLTQLARIGSFKVISRTSVMEYAGDTKNIREIGEELGVRTVLEGGVQRAGDRVRINAQLIDARTDEHLWAESYDRELTAANIFDIQADLARRIAAALHTTLTPEEQRQIAARPTEDLEAYELYLQARAFANRSWRESDLRAAMRLLQEAVELDPGFAVAHADLSWTHSALWWFHYDRTADRLASAKRAVDAALALDPDLPEAHAALGWYYYWGHLDYERALAEFAIAERAMPNNAEVKDGIASVRRRQGRFREALDYFMEARELDPRSALEAAEVGETQMLLRDYRAAERSFDGALRLGPDIADVHTMKAQLYLGWDGSTYRARGVLEEARRLSAEPASLIAWMAALVEWLDRDYRVALKLARELPAVAVDDQFSYIPRTLFIGDVHRALRAPELARAHYDSAAATLRAKIREHPEDSRYYTALGLAYAGLGRTNEAVRMAERGYELLPIEKEAYRGAQRLLELAKVYAAVGEEEKALAAIETLLSRPSPLMVGFLRLDPGWDPLREQPRFRALLGDSGA